MISLFQDFLRFRRIRLFALPLGAAFFFIPLFFIFLFAAIAHSAQVNLVWDLPTESGITGYKIYYGTSSRPYPNSVDVGNRTSCTVTNLLDKTTYYFAATDYNGIGQESAFSNEVVYTTPAPVSGCNYSISPTAQSYSASGGSGAVTVTAGSACAWTAVSNASWIIITSNSSASGAGTVNYSVSGNTGAASRTGTLTIAGRDFSVSQSGALNYTITASSGSGGSISPSGEVTISAGGSQTFTTAPSGGYQVSSLVVDGSNLGPLTAYAFTDVKANHTISVSFIPSSGSWTFCANEGGLCSFSGTQNVRYGANGVYVTKSLTNGTMCTNSVFGDPIYGVAKQCFVQASGNFTLTASAGTGGTISPSGSVQVVSGGAQTFNIAAASGYQVVSVLVDGTDRGALTTYSFTNVTANHTISASFAPSSGSWTFCANEGGLCSFSGTQNVRYGASGVYVTKSLTNGTMCTNSVFGDPINGVAKQCYVSAGTVVFAVNSGGPQYTLSDGTNFESDRNYIGGATWTTSAAISGTSNGPLYQSERYGNFSYSIPLPNGNYTVWLRFAEIYMSSSGQRVFDVFIEGTKVLSNFDIFALVGKNYAYAVSFPATVVDGKLEISFRSIVDNAKVSAIMVQPR